jgi:guanylate kinase
MSSQNDGIVVILSSPSGAGKTTLVKLISEKKNFNISVSHTTRKPRSNEIDGKDYYFVSDENFEILIKNNQFLEYAKVFINFYGTSKKPVLELLNSGKNGRQCQLHLGLLCRQYQHYQIYLILLQQFCC